jgi:translation elongation factor EF-Ts
MQKLTPAHLKKLKEQTGLGYIEAIKKLRADHNVSLALAVEALEEGEGDWNASVAYIKDNWRGNTGKPTNAGLIYTYQHPQDIPRIGVMLEVRCGTDFVAKGEPFKALCRELALQLVAGLEGPLEAQAYVRDSSRTVESLIAEYSQTLGENIRVERTVRWELGTNHPEDDRKVCTS